MSMSMARQSCLPGLMTSGLNPLVHQGVGDMASMTTAELQAICALQGDDAAQLRLPHLGHGGIGHTAAALHGLAGISAVSAPHSTQPGADEPERMQQLVSKGLRSFYNSHPRIAAGLSSEALYNDLGGGSLAEVGAAAALDVQLAELMPSLAGLDRRELRGQGGLDPGEEARKIARNALLQRRAASTAHQRLASASLPTGVELGSDDGPFAHLMHTLEQPQQHGQQAHHPRRPGEFPGSFVQLGGAPGSWPSTTAARRAAVDQQLQQQLESAQLAAAAMAAGDASEVDPAVWADIAGGPSDLEGMVGVPGMAGSNSLIAAVATQPDVWKLLADFKRDQLLQQQQPLNGHYGALVDAGNHTSHLLEQQNEELDAMVAAAQQQRQQAGFHGPLHGSVGQELRQRVQQQLEQQQQRRSVLAASLGQQRSVQGAAQDMPMPPQQQQQQKSLQDAILELEQRHAGSLGRGIPHPGVMQTGAARSGQPQLGIGSNGSSRCQEATAGSTT